MKRQITKVLIVAALLIPFLSTHPASADPVGGRQVWSGRVNSNYAKSYHVRCYANEATRIRVQGDGVGNTTLDLYVIDSGGNLIAFDLHDPDEVTFTPRFTGDFTVMIVNRGTVYNDFTMIAD